MTWQKLKYIVLDLMVFCLKNWKLVGGLICLLFIAYFVQQCRSGRQQKKIDDIKSNLSQSNGEIKILTNQKANVESRVNQAANESKQAINAAENIRNANFANTKLSDAEKARCLAYPENCK